MQESLEEQGPAHNSFAAWPCLGRVLYHLSRLMAVIGGLIFSALILMSLVSIIGRKLFGWAVPGDMEVLQMAAACASASFFAYCHLTHSDVKVDFFTHKMSARRIALMDAIGSLTVALFGAVLTWRTAVGAMSLKEIGETSTILEWPVWLAQAFMVPGFFLLAVVGAYVCLQHLAVALKGGEA